MSDQQPPPELLAMMRYFATLRTKPAGHDHDTPGSTPYNGMVLLPDQFAYVVNYRTNRLIHPMGFEQVLGYPDDTIDLEFIFRYIHPDDLPVVTRMVERAVRTIYDLRTPVRPFTSVMSMDYRIRKANGEYIKILRQTTVFEVDEERNTMLSTLSICKDISSIKPSNRVGWQGLGPGTEQMDMRDILRENGNLVYRPTAREMDVIRKMAEGKSSKVIAAELNLSRHTVNNHRRNLLQRTGLKNTTELVRQISELGWL